MTNVPYHVHEFAIPTPSEAEARAGTSTSSAMHPLATKQSIDAEVGVTIASSAQGLLAGTALQPSDVSAVAISGDYDDLLNKPDVTSVTQQNFSVVAGQTSVTIPGGYVIGRVYQVFLNGILLDNGTWSASNGSTVTFSAITNADIIEGESSASLTVAIGAASILIPSLDARYQRITSVNGLSLGATPNVIAANTAALQAAFDALPSTGGKIVFPAGYYFFYTGSLIIPAVPVTIVGSGMDVTTLVFFGAPGWTGRSAGFYFPNTVNGIDRINMPVTISDMTFWAADASCGAAIDMRFKSPGIYKSQAIERVRFVSAKTFSGDPFNAGDLAIRWDIGVDLTNAIHGHIRDCYFAGANQSVLPNSALTSPMVAAVAYRGNSNKQTFEGNAVVFTDTGVYADPSAYAEAMKVDKCTFGLCNWGVYAPYTAAGIAPRVMTISDNDFETIVGGIYGSKRHEWDISENKIWKRGESTANWAGIVLDNCERTDVSRNKIWGRVAGVAGGSSIAILMANCHGSGIEDNHLGGVNIGVDFGNSGSGIAHHNRWDDGSINTIPGAYVTPFTNKPASWTWESNNAGYPTSYVE